MNEYQLRQRYPKASPDFIKMNAIEPSLEPVPVRVERRRRLMNKTEAEYEAILKAKWPQPVRYEAYTLKLAHDLRYTPDFAVCFSDGAIHFHEVKGKFIFSRAMQKPKMAATLFPWHRFFLAQKINGEWKVEQIKSDG